MKEMDISWIELFVISLASFRLTRLIVFDNITEFLRTPFFDEVIEVGPDGEEEAYYVPKKGIISGPIGELLSCYWCTGIWVALAVCIFYFLWPHFATPFILVMAVAGMGAIIETLIQRWL